MCAGSTTSSLTALNRVTWYSRSDAAQVGQRGIGIEIRYKVPTSGLRYRSRITQGTLCGTTYIRGTSAGESGTVTCPGAPVTVAATDLITLQLIYPYWNFLMIGEVRVA